MLFWVHDIRRSVHGDLDKSEKPVRRLFANVPAYLLKSGETPRSTKKAGCSSRREAKARRLEELEVSFNVSDDITDLSLSDSRQATVVNIALTHFCSALHKTCQRSSLVYV